MWSFCISSLRSGFRSRAFLLILILGVLLVGVSYLAASFSPRQPKTVTIDVGFSGIRFSLVLFSVFWVQELVGREVERRTVLYALAYPVSRAAYILGRFLGIVSLLAFSAIVLGVMLWVAARFSGGQYLQGHTASLGLPYWTGLIGLWADSVVVAAFALWIATLSTVPLLPIALGSFFAVAGKTLGATLDYLERGADGDQILVSRFGPALQFVQVILPDLSRLDWRVWPMYGIPPAEGTVLFGLLLGAGYTVILLSLAVVTFSRREFF